MRIAPLLILFPAAMLLAGCAGTAASPGKVMNVRTAQVDAVAGYTPYPDPRSDSGGSMLYVGPTLLASERDVAMVRVIEVKDGHGVAVVLSEEAARRIGAAWQEDLFSYLAVFYRGRLIAAAPALGGDQANVLIPGPFTEENARRLAASIAPRGAVISTPVSSGPAGIVIDLRPR